MSGLAGRPAVWPRAILPALAPAPPRPRPPPAGRPHPLRGADAPSSYPSTLRLDPLFLGYICFIMVDCREQGSLNFFFEGQLHFPFFNVGPGRSVTENDMGRSDYQYYCGDVILMIMLD